MKFAKELEQDAVPEWRIKYLNYKAGKKYVKAVARAVHRANATPRGVDQQTPSFYTAQSTRPTPRYDGLRDDDDDEGDDGDSFFERTTSNGGRTQYATPQAMAIPPSQTREDEALTGQGDGFHYGSIVATPPVASPMPEHETQGAFELPAPAMRPEGDSRQPQRPTDAMRKRLSHMKLGRSSSASALPRVDTGKSRPGSGSDTRLLPKRMTDRDHITQSPSQLRRLFSHGGNLPRSNTKNDVSLQPFDLVREREADFYSFMDSELDKVESFYKLKEEQAGQRLNVLKEQLHEMRNRRIHEIAESRRINDQEANGHHHGHDHASGHGGWVAPIKAKIFPLGPNSKAFQFMPRTPMLGASNSGDAGRDYIRRPEDQDVSYRTAKRKLKVAIHEFYRGLELLKSYALLNRTAFRKLNKKFDKAVNARPPYRYMNEKVNKAWFVSSDVLEGHIRVVEDLYARYFERGNHKLAAGKLRSLTKKHGEHSGSAFQSGFLIGTGLVFTVQGAIYGAQLLSHDNLDLRTRTSYLLQIYGGYFLMLILFALFVVDCMVWTRNKINYPFIFEFDQRHHLDWRALAEFPSFFLLLFGVFIWANFSRYGPESLYEYYPVMLIGLTVFIIFMPFPIFAHRARKWLAYSHWRLLLAGIYPVEFRDFFLGDIYCSLTYAMANAELFFCLYAKEWEKPVQCNSSHSRIMGFLAALPPIWRFLQCIRRYKDTRNIFPHLVNCGKYTMTIMSAVTLSLYRIRGSQGNLALFITFSLINSVYCSIWDLFMDFSLVQADSKHFALRDILALKKRWPYYTIMVIDPIIRFAWIFYAIFTHDRQHSTIVSFLTALMEVIRRGMWALFRVENEHCANVSQYKASRDVPLPYRIEPLMDRASAESSPIDQEHPQLPQQVDAAPHSPEQQRRAQRQSEAEQGNITGSSTAVASTLGTLRNRADTMSGRSFSKLLAEAHKQDFQKRRKTAAEQAIEDEGGNVPDDEDDDDDEDQETDFEVEEAEDLRHRAMR